MAIAESGRFGGTCVNVGCIPKKLFSYAAHFRDEFETAREYGWTAHEPRFDWRTLLANKDREIARLNGVMSNSLHAGVHYFFGAKPLIRGKKRNRKTANRHCKAHPRGHGMPARARHTRRRAWRSPRRGVLPESCGARAGGGRRYIAVDFASIFNPRRGPTLAYAGRTCCAASMPSGPPRAGRANDREGVSILLRTNLASTQALSVTFRTARRSGFDLVMFYTGRRSNTAGSASRARASTRRRRRDHRQQYSKSSVDSIHAPSRRHQPAHLTAGPPTSHGAVEDAVRRHADPVDHEYVPKAVFANPPRHGAFPRTRGGTAFRRGEIYKDRVPLNPAQHGRAQEKSHEAGDGRGQPAAGRRDTCSAPTRARSSRARHRG